MGLLNNLLKKIAQSPFSAITNTTDIIAKHYLMSKSSSPELSNNEIYKQIIELRYSTIPLKEEWRYKNMLDRAENIPNLKELIFEIITNESPELLGSGMDNIVMTLEIIGERLEKEYNLK